MRTLAFLVAVLSLAGSSPSRGGELSAIELKNARKLYVGKCAKCHKLPDPEGYTPQQWDSWMGKMTDKSKLKPDQVALLNRYVAAGRSGEVKLPK